MDQDLAWWSEAVFSGWRQRPGPRYQRLAAALLDAVESRVLREGTRVPAERTLAAAVGVSRGTVVASFDHLVAAGVLRRRQGAGTYVVGRPSWAARPADSSIAALLLRRVAGDRETTDLSISSPGDLGHLPPVDLNDTWSSLDGHGLDPSGLPQLRVEVARHLSEHQQLPTEPGQIVITAGAQEALWLLSRALAPRSGSLVTTCPTYPGLAGAFSSTRRSIVAVGTDAAGAEPSSIERASRAPGTLVYLMPTGHNPTGTVMTTMRRQAVAAIADAGRATIIEDLTLADLVLDNGPPPQPLAALSTRVIAIGSASKLLWGGLRVGWIRAPEPLRTAVITQKAAVSLATAAVGQALTAQLLAAIGPDWLAAHRSALARRRDHLADMLAARLPAWRIQKPPAGLSLWAELPLDSADAFAHVAARHRVTIAPGSAACVDSRHHHYIRLSFADQLDILDLAAERLAAAWETYAQDLAASPARIPPGDARRAAAPREGVMTDARPAGSTGSGVLPDDRVSVTG
jgi:DNA-binding transcriptional MocR family regulator